MKTRTLLAAATLAVLHPCCAHASDPPTSLEEVTVTASRVSSPALSAALPVEVIGAAELEARQSLAMTDVLRGRNSVAIAQAGPIGGLTELRLRGAEANHVQMRMDGIVLNDPAIGSSVDIAQLNLIGVRQIEVLRGAQSGVWGSDAMAGVINLDTRPAPGTQRRRLDLEGGSDETVSTAVHLSDAGDRAYYGLSANYFDTDGTNAALEGNEEDGYRNATGHLVAGYDAGRWGVDGVLRYTDAKSEFDPTPFPGFVPTDGDYELDVEQRYGRIGARFDVDERWNHRLYYNYLDTDNRNVVAGSTTDSTEGGRDLLGYQTDIRFGSVVEQRLTLAYEHTEEDYRQRGEPSPFGDPNFDEEIEIDSFIVEHETTWRDLVAVVSLRYDDNSDFDNATSFRLAARYRLGAATTLFAGYGKGSKNPTFTERFGFTPDTFFGNPDLEPEESLNLNMGLEQTLGAIGVVRLMLFRDRLNDEIDGFVFDPVLLGFTAINRDGTSRRQGIELTSRWTLPFALALEADYSYVDASEPDGAGDVHELRRPEHTGRLDLAFTGADRWSARVGAEYVGTRDDVDFGVFQRVSLGSYTLVHATTRYRITSRFEVRGRIENAFDEDYEDVFGYRSPGRRIIVGLSVDL